MCGNGGGDKHGQQGCACSCDTLQAETFYMGG